MAQFLQRYASRFALWGLLFMLASRLAQANDPHQVGLVVVHGNGEVTTQCVAFQGEEINGYELLEQSNLDLNIDASNSLGATICRLDGEGCNYPQDDCFCQCQSSKSCIYWSYWHLNGGQWQYSSLGSSSYTLHGGEVQGWVWGKGSVGSSADKAPPETSFEAICAPPPTDTPTPTATATPSATETATPSPTATNTPQPPTVTPTQHAANSMNTFDEVGLVAPLPTITPTTELLATSPPTMTATPKPQDTPMPLAVATSSPTQTASPSPTATTLAQLAAATPVASSTPWEVLPTTTRHEILPSPTATFTPQPQREIALVAVATVPPLTIEKRRIISTDNPPESSSWFIFSTLASLLLLLVLALPVILLLIGGVVWWLRSITAKRL